MTSPFGTLAEIRTSIALVRHVNRDGDLALGDALAALSVAEEDQGVSAKKVAVLIARYYAVQCKASGIDPDLWASIAISAAEDWEHE